MVANQRKILVTGATGQQGGSLARLLLQKNIRYMHSRNTQSSAAQDLRNRGANIVKGDLDDSDSLKHAVKDVESLFLMGTPFEDGTEGETQW
ncbi:MAG: NmrA family NAD(P)-binding protein [Nitrososphaeraceae archaeon]